MNVHAPPPIHLLRLALTAVLLTTACGDGLNVGAINPVLVSGVSGFDAGTDSPPDRRTPDAPPLDVRPDVAQDGPPADVPSTPDRPPDLSLSPDLAPDIGGAVMCDFPPCFRELLRVMSSCPREGMCVEQAFQSMPPERQICFQNGTRVNERPVVLGNGSTTFGEVSSGSMFCFLYQLRRGANNEAIIRYSYLENSLTGDGDVTVFTDGRANILCPGDTVRTFAADCGVPALIGLDPAAPKCVLGPCPERTSQ